MSDVQPLSFGNAVARGLKHLDDVRGRDTRAEFWPYAASVIGVGMVLGNAVLVPILLIRVVRDPSNTGNGTAWSFLVVTAVVALTIIGLLASAVARRLHDRNVLGRWACIPALLLFSALIIFGLLTKSFDHDPSPTLLLLGFANNAIYLVAIIVLVIQLMLPGTTGDNRFGAARE